MRIEVLGELRVLHAGRELDLGPPSQRRTLALLLAAPDGLTTGQVVDELWGAGPPETATHAVEVYVSRLRRILGAAGADGPVRHGNRYRLVLAPGESDAADLEARAAAARQLLIDDPLAARAALAELEQRWRGPPFDGLADDSPLLRTEVTRLERCHLDVVADRVLADLILGEHDRVAPELNRLTTEHPGCEPLWRHRMLAEYRCGRMTDALRAAAELRAWLRTELGADPTPDTDELERRILRCDPSLDWSPPAPPCNLPSPATTFVGRDTELATLAELLPTTRVLTLIGPGGVGKTRLAVELASRSRDAYPGGVRWVDLSAVGAAEVTTAVARALGIADRPELAMAPAIARTLTRRPTLVVLDNCERVAVAVADLLAAVLPSAATARFLATSRVPLHLTAETRWPVPGLDTDRSTERPDAVRLFGERARQLLGPAGVDDAEREQVHELCRRLDGLPLAIEMAASHLDVLSVPELAQSLDDRFRLLVRDERDVAGRHRSLAAVLDWSYDRLTDDGRSLLDRLAVIRGPIDLDAVVAIGRLGDGDRHEAARCVEALIDASLLGSRRGHRPPRFAMLETVREYGIEHLRQRGELERVRNAHAAHYLDLAIAAGPDVKTPAFARWAPILMESSEDVLAALATVLEQPDPLRAHRAARGLFGFWFATGRPVDADRWGRRMLDVTPLPAGGTDLADVHLCIAFGSDLLGRPDDTRDHALEALRRFDAAGDARGRCWALFALASAALQTGRIDDVFAHCAAALAICDATGDRWSRADPLSTLAIVLSEAPEHLVEAREMAEEALDLHRALGDVAGQVVLNPLPMIARAEHDLDGAERAARTAVAVSVGSGWEAAARSWLTIVLTDRGRLADADHEARLAVERAVAAGLDGWASIAVRNVARLAVRHGRHEVAAFLVGGAQRRMPPYGFGAALDAEIHDGCAECLGTERTEALVHQGAAASDEEVVAAALGQNPSGGVPS